jgi:histone H3/H4
MVRRKILRDNIQGITNNELRRLAYTAGISRLGNSSYEEIRGYIKVKLEDIIYKTILYLEYERKLTIDEYMITASISPKMWSDTVPKAKSCIRKSAQSKRRSRSKSKRSKSSKKSRSKSRDVLKNVSFYQKRYECLNLAKSSFARYVREVVQDFKTDVRITKKALIILQYSVENYIIKLLEKSLQNALYRKSMTVEPKDIQYAAKNMK